MTRFEFEDALLIDAGGNVVFSAYKDVDLGTNIVEGPYAGSKLQEAYLKAMSSNAVDYVGFTDFEFYQPAENSPTAWMVAPLRRDGRAEGVLALQFPIDKINRLMTFDKQWSDAGLGQTGETILAGPGRVDEVGFAPVPGESTGVQTRTSSRRAPRPTSPTWPSVRAGRR